VCASSDDSNLDKLVVDWQADLFKQVSALSDTPKQSKENFEKVQGKLLKVWDKTDKPSSLKNAKDALDSLSSAFTGGAKTFVQGVKDGDAGSISKGVLDIASSVFSAIGTFSEAMGVVGAVLGFASSIMDFVLSLFGGPESHGTTSITEVMRRVVSYELQENNVEELQTDYEGVYHEISRIHNIFDDLQPSDENQAVSLLDESNFKQLTTQLTEFIGTIEGTIKNRFQYFDQKDLKVLFKMYWESNLQFSIIQQRAVGFITSAVTNTSDLSKMPTKYFVYVENLQSQRDLAKEFLKSQGPTLDAFSKTLLVGQPGNPETFHLKLDWQDDLYIGRTAHDSGYPYASLRPESSPLEIHWEDDSQWMDKSAAVVVDEFISFVNPETDAEEQDRIVFYFGAGWYGKYMDKQEAGYSNGGSDQKIDKVLFKFERTGDGTGSLKDVPLKDGETVIVKNKEYDSVVMCGGDDGKDHPMVSDEDPTAYYIRQAKPDDCMLSHWKIVVSGNSDLKRLSEEWSKFYGALTANDPDDAEVVTTTVIASVIV